MAAYSAYGLIGYPLVHSFSPRYFAAKFFRETINATYTAFPIKSIAELPMLIDANKDLRGLNVTIPYKQAVIPCLDKLSTAAREIGAVNCIAIHDGRLTGYNTDAIGFEQSLVPLLQPHHTQALVLGTGGAALAVNWVLRKLGIPYQNVSRTEGPGCICYDDLTKNIVAGHTLIINATPSGMYPSTDGFPPIPYDGISSKHLLYDLIYNPEETIFLSMGKDKGATTKNGHEMLILQAEASWQIWKQQQAYPTV